MLVTSAKTQPIQDFISIVPWRKSPQMAEQNQFSCDSFGSSGLSFSCHQSPVGPNTMGRKRLLRPPHRPKWLHWDVFGCGFGRVPIYNMDTIEFEWAFGFRKWKCWNQSRKNSFEEKHHHHPWLHSWYHHCMETKFQGWYRLLRSSGRHNHYILE